MVIGLSFAGGLSQFPKFAQQYTQRVGGAYFELRDVADGFRADAAANGKTVEQVIGEYRNAGSQFFQDRGDSIEQVITREAYLRNHYEVLSGGDGFDQLIVFARDRDVEIAYDTLGIYKSALLLTFTGAAHAALGFLLGFVLLKFSGLLRRRRTAVA